MDNPAITGIFRGMALDTDILIVGGGLNGPCLALALSQAGLTSIVIDALPVEMRDADSFDGRSYALALASARLLQAIGVWEGVKANAQAMHEIKASDGRAGEGPAPFFLHFERDELEEGPMGYMLEDRFLRQALLTRMEADPNITHLPCATVVAQDTSGPASVTLEDDRVLTGRLLIGADGRRSGTGARAGIKRMGWDYGQTALVCSLSHDLPHHGIAHQFFMPAGPLAILPLPGNRCSIVWSETHARAAEINALNDEDYLDVLRPRFGDFLGQISLAGSRFTYPLNLTISERFVADRLALIGDAAHGVHPIAGQGLNLGLRDVGALAEVLADAKRRGEDIASLLVLERYQRWRRFDTAALAASTDLINRLFSNDNTLLRTTRDLGMGMVNALPGLRRTFMREAAGLTGDVPRLMQGKPL